MKKALITGITGQDGSYLAELLLDKGYEVHGMIRRTSTNNQDRLKTFVENPNLYLHVGDLTEMSSVTNIIKDVFPDEVYNLGAQSHVHTSFESPEYTANADAIGPLRILESIRFLGQENRIKFYQAGTSEMFGLVQNVPQNENTPFYPRSPYGVSKLYAHWITKNYRESYGFFATNGILFNHESPRRGSNFVTQKIVKALYNISSGNQDFLELGNLNAKRDWGHAKDFVKAMWLMLQQDKPDDYVIATGQQHSVKDFIKISSHFFDFDIEWHGQGLDEIGVDSKSGKTIIKVNQKLFRPSEVDSLIGDYSKAKSVLGWEPKHSFEDLVFDMCKSEISNFKDVTT